jgi:hypothetical protein
MSKQDKYFNIILDLKERHERLQFSLQSIVDLDPSAKIVIKDNGNNEIEMPKEHIKGFKFGVGLALEMLGNFPVSVDMK